MTAIPDARLQLLSAALMIEQDLHRKARLADLAHALVNDTIPIHGQDCAFLCLPGLRGWRLESVASVSQVDRTGPFAQWLAKTAARLQADGQPLTPRVLTAEEIALPAEDWAQGFPEHWLWLPLERPGGVAGGLALLRSTPWQEIDLLLAQPMAVSYGHALWAVRGRLPRLDPGRRLTWRQKAAILAALALAAVFPVHLDTIAPAEIAPQDPIPVTAPFDGIIAEVPVHSYQPVKAGDVLASFDARELTMKAEVAARTLDVAVAELTSLRNQAFFDPESKAKLAVAEQKVQLQKEELAYAEDRLSRHQLKAAEDGVVLYDDRFTLQGKPVSAGQTLMTLAKPDHKEIQIDIPAAALIPLEAGNDVKLFLDMDPSHSIDATLTRIGYEARPVPGGGLAYRYVASFKGNPGALQLGARGTAKISGQRVLLAYYLLRRPWASVRQFLGF